MHFCERSTHRESTLGAKASSRCRGAPGGGSWCCTRRTPWWRPRSSGPSLGGAVGEGQGRASVKPYPNRPNRTKTEAALNTTLTRQPPPPKKPAPPLPPTPPRPLAPLTPQPHPIPPLSGESPLQRRSSRSRCVLRDRGKSGIRPCSGNKPAVWRLPWVRKNV